MHLLGAWTRPRTARLIWHIHDYVSLRRLMRRLLWPFRRAASAAIVNSRSVAKDLERVFPGLHIVPIYNAIDLQRFSAAGNKSTWTVPPALDRACWNDSRRLDRDLRALEGA